eukprot:354475-Chlamydomonas_euryale.AAC.2
MWRTTACWRSRSPGRTSWRHLRHRCCATATGSRQWALRRHRCGQGELLAPWLAKVAASWRLPPIGGKLQTAWAAALCGVQGPPVWLVAACGTVFWVLRLGAVCGTLFRGVASGCGHVVRCGGYGWTRPIV